MLACRGRAGSHLRVRLAETGLEITKAALPNSAVDSGKTHFRPLRVPSRRWKSHCNQNVEPVLAAPAGSRNRARFAPVGSRLAVEFNGMLAIAKFGIIEFTI